MSEQQNAIRIIFSYYDTTFRWPCRKGDFLLWCRFKGLRANPQEAYTLADIWELKDGDHIIITNRIEDLPNGFQLHPTETKNALAYKMMQKLDDGYKPGDIIDGPNIWRIMAGDTIAWVGKTRPCYDSINNILQIVDFEKCGLIIGESTNMGFESFISFGELSNEDLSPEEADPCRNAIAEVQKRGLPSTFSGKWGLG